MGLFAFQKPLKGGGGCPSWFYMDSNIIGISTPALLSRLEHEWNGMVGNKSIYYLLAVGLNEWLIIFVLQYNPPWFYVFMISNQVICPKTDLSVPPPSLISPLY